MKKAHNKSVIIPFPFMMRVFRLLLLVAAFLVPRTCCLGQKSNADVLRQTLHFGERFNALPADTMSTNVYLKYSINVVKRNATLATVPTMYYILRDRGIIFPRATPVPPSITVSTASTATSISAPSTTAIPPSRR